MSYTFDHRSLNRQEAIGLFTLVSSGMYRSLAFASVGEVLVAW